MLASVHCNTLQHCGTFWLALNLSSEPATFCNRWYLYCTAGTAGNTEEDEYSLVLGARQRLENLARVTVHHSHHNTPRTGRVTAAGTPVPGATGATTSVSGNTGSTAGNTGDAGAGRSTSSTVPALHLPAEGSEPLSQPLSEIHSRESYPGLNDNNQGASGASSAGHSSNGSSRSTSFLSHTIPASVTPAMQSLSGNASFSFDRVSAAGDGVEGPPARLSATSMGAGAGHSNRPSAAGCNNQQQQLLPASLQPAAHSPGSERQSFAGGDASRLGGRVSGTGDDTPRLSYTGNTGTTRQSVTGEVAGRTSTTGGIARGSTAGTTGGPAVQLSGTTQVVVLQESGSAGVTKAVQQAPQQQQYSSLQERLKEEVGPPTGPFSGGWACLSSQYCPPIPGRHRYYFFLKCIQVTSSAGVHVASPTCLAGSIQCTSRDQHRQGVKGQTIRPTHCQAFLSGRQDGSVVRAFTCAAPQARMALERRSCVPSWQLSAG
jgi:hypothetical protein